MRIVTQDRSWGRQDVKDITINFAKWLDVNKDVNKDVEKTYEELFDTYNKEKKLNV